MWYDGVLISTWSRTQATVSLSSAESELLAMSVATQEGQGVQHVLEELGEAVPLLLCSDSSAARAVIKRRGPGRMKHLTVRSLWLQDELRAGRLQLFTVRSSENEADLFTKTFTAGRYKDLVGMIGLESWTDESDTWQ